MNRKKWRRVYKEKQRENEEMSVEKWGEIIGGREEKRKRGKKKERRRTRKGVNGDSTERRERGIDKEI